MLSWNVIHPTTNHSLSPPYSIVLVALSDPTGPQDSWPTLCVMHNVARSLSMPSPLDCPYHSLYSHKNVCSPSQGTPIIDGAYTCLLALMVPPICTQFHSTLTSHICAHYHTPHTVMCSPTFTHMHPCIVPIDFTYIWASPHIWCKRTCALTHLCASAHMHVHSHTYACTWTHALTCTHACTHTHALTHACTHSHLRTTPWIPFIVLAPISSHLFYTIFDCYCSLPWQLYPTALSFLCYLLIPPWHVTFPLLHLSAYHPHSHLALSHIIHCHIAMCLSLLLLPSFLHALVPHITPWLGVHACSQHCYDSLTCPTISHANLIKTSSLGVDKVWRGVL